MEPRILILDGDQRASLAAVRSLGSKGFWVGVGESSTTSLASQSRFCAKHIAYTNPSESPRRFFDDILEQVTKLNISFLLPITETTTYIILKYREELPKDVVLPFPDTDSVENLANKNNLFRRARQIGIPIPDTIFFEEAEDAAEAIDEIDKFPIVLKPYKSKILLDNKIISTNVIIAHSPDEARSALRTFDFPFTIQSFVEGKGQGIFALFDRGKPLCYFSHRRLREKPPEGGVSVLCEAIPVDKELKKSAEQLLIDESWHGVAMVEFRVASDGSYFLMEVNPRFWGSLQLAIDSGIDFPWFLFLISTGTPIPEITWRHRRLRWLLGDLDRLYLVLKAPLRIYTLREKLREIFLFLKPGWQTQHEVNRLNDLKPFWFELRRYFDSLRP